MTDASGTLTLDTDKIRARLTVRLHELGKTARGASREAGLGDSAIRNIMEGRSKSPRLSTLLALASVLEVQPDWFLDAHGTVDLSEAKTATALVFVSGEMRRLSHEHFRNSLPMYIPRIIEDNLFILPEKAFMFIDHPEFIRSNIYQFVFVVRGRAMWPVFREDDILLVDPGLDPDNNVQDEDYLFVEHKERKAILARLISSDDTGFMITAFEPAREVRIEKNQYVAHRIAKRVRLF